MAFLLSCKNIENNSENKTLNLTDAKIKLYKNKIIQDPSNYGNYDNLAQNYIQKARETGESNYYTIAENTVKKSLKINPNNYVGIVLYAKTKMANHEFKKAHKYAKSAIALKPERSVAYGILGDASLELRDIDGAKGAYQKMLDINPGIDSYSRISNLKGTQGEFNEAIAYMMLAYESGLKNAETPKENLAWTQFMIGRFYIEMENYNEAEKYFTKSLEIYNDYFLAVEQLAKVRHLKADKTPIDHQHGLDGNPHHH